MPGLARAIAFAALCVCVLSAAAAAGETIRGTVTRVWDGDTVTLTADGVDHRVRLAAIDAPEHGQPYADEARRELSRLVLDRAARLETERADPFGRLVGRLWVQPQSCPGCGQTLDAGLAMLTTGHAWWYRRYAHEQTPEARGQYEFAEQEARAKQAGLWQDEQPTPPWDWKRDRRNAPEDSGCRIKGNISTSGRIYHLPGQRYYDRTTITASKGERWFCTEADARAAGWRRARE
ncbi:MAG: thermonuclease family protein [Pseudomonadales bacterium]